MIVGIASDHRGFTRKQELIEQLENLEYNVVDYGAYSEVSIDYPDVAFQLGEAVAKQECDCGIILCQTGIGVSIACNKVKKIRCAKVDTVEEAKMTRFHNDANIIAMSAKLPLEVAQQITTTFLTTEFSKDERHIRRIEKLTNYEDHLC